MAAVRAAHCPTWNEDTNTPCGTRLRAPEDAIETHCRTCKTTHRVDRLQLTLMSELRRAKLTFAQIRETNRQQGDDYRVNERTLRDWRQTGVLRECGRDNTGEPLYRWGDIEQLRAHGVPRRTRRRTAN